MKKLIFYIAFPLLLISCVPQQYSMDIDDKLSEGNGLVFVTVSSNSFMDYWSSITLAQIEGEQENKTFSIFLNKEPSSRSALYVGQVPPGKYKLQTLSGTYILTVPEAVGTFNVKSNTITDLGHLIFQNIGMKGGLFKTSTDSVNVRSLISTYFKNLLPYTSNDFLTWNNSYLIDKSLTKAFAANPAGRISPSELPSGNFLFGTKIGQIKIWNPLFGNTKIINTPIYTAIEDILIIDEKHWYIAGEFNTILKTIDGGNSWINISPKGLPYGLIESININSSEQLIITLLQKDKVSIYRSYTNEGTEWTEIFSKELEFSFWTGMQVQPKTYLSEDQIFVTLPTDEAVVLNVNSLTSKLISMPGSIQSANLTGDRILRCKCTQTLAVNPYYSDDLGISWKDSNTDRFMTLPIFKDDKIGIAVQHKWLSDEKHIMKTVDGGKTWSAIAPLTESIGDFYFSKVSDTIYTFDEFSIFESKDGGITWKNTVNLLEEHVPLQFR